MKVCLAGNINHDSAKPTVGNERIWNALRLAKALITATIGTKISIFLIDDAVATAKKGQKPPEGYYNLKTCLKNLIANGVNVVACRTCVSARGLTVQELVEGVRVGTTVGDLTQWVKESPKVLTF